ncbi:MAG: NEW3 domain-containing protein [Firmicutes bacterium]|nr:NEW3 domain-containing protein [Bacillota bacterium]
MRGHHRRLFAWLTVWLLAVAIVLPFRPTPAAAASERAVVELWQALVPLRSVNTFMNTGAHPDDEQSSLLAYLSQGVGARVISVIATRGEGGQNAIGAEYNAALGVVRSRELEEAGKAFGVEVRHLSQDFADPIYDFGFSKTPEETLAHWGHDRALERLVRIIRETRPDVVMPSFLDVDGQHGHHRAVTVLTLEAFRAAADPEAFPEHLEEGLRPWQIKKLYLPAAESRGTYDSEGIPPTLEVPVGEYNPILGASYVQIGEESRAYHKSQGMGQQVPEGPRTFPVHLLESKVPVPQPEQSLFDGLPRTVGDLAERVEDRELKTMLQSLQEIIDAAVAAYPDYQRVSDLVHKGLNVVRQARARIAALAWADPELRDDLDHRLAVKEQQLARASRAAVLLVTRLTADTYEITRGASATLTLTAFVGGPVPLEDVRLELAAPAGWQVEPVEVPAAARLGYNQTLTARFKVTAPADAPFFHPYRPLDLYGLVHYTAAGVPVTVKVEPAADVAVLPDLSLQPQPDGLIYNLEEPGKLTVTVVATSYRDGPVETELSLAAPTGWQVEPAAAPIAFQGRGEVRSVRFTVTPPAGLAPGRYTLRVQAEGQARSGEYVRVIEYDHIGRTYMVLPAAVEVQAFPVKVPKDLRVGYVASGFDRVPEALRQLGIQVDLLDEEDLTSGDLSVYDTIVVGIRALRVRPDLVAAMPRLHEYVYGGGNLVVQYHQPGDNWDPERSAPYYLQIGSPSIRWRVTDEASPVTVLVPDHPLLNRPNAIGPEDWQGWVKDRGLYFPSEWAPEFTPLLAMHDPGEPPLTGSLLTATYGKGRYTYTSLILYYQLEQRVPGAYRLFVNLITP